LTRPPGFTLIEMVVVITLMGVLAGIGGLAFAGLREPPVDLWAVKASRSRGAAVDSGIAVMLPGDSIHEPVMFLPDGRAVGGGAVSPLTGEILRAAR
jgi:prepilin-type N-terminal cleavage/methylation domain-containing protein